MVVKAIFTSLKRGAMARPRAVVLGILSVALVNILKEYNMHSNEEFLKKSSPTELFTLEVEAEARGKAYLQAYREQLRRLEIVNINA
jgi:hypothetical protein